MEHHFSPFTSAYRKSFSTKHVLIRLLEDWRTKLDNNVVRAVLTDLSKAFDCIRHDLLVTNLDTFGFNRDTVAYVYSYLKSRKQCVKSYPGDIISGVPQGSILGPILYSFFFNDFFYFILLATARNFADDNTLACFGSSEFECKVALNWFNESKMIVNPGKFQAIGIGKRKLDHTNEIFKIGSKEIKVAPQVNFLG